MKHHFDANHLSSFKWQLLKNTSKSKWMESNLALLSTKQCENSQTERWMVFFFSNANAKNFLRFKWTCFWKRCQLMKDEFIWCSLNLMDSVTATIDNQWNNEKRTVFYAFSSFAVTWCHGSWAPYSDTISGFLAWHLGS